MAEGIRIPIPPGAELVQPYPVHVPQFDGPLDLLLHLISKHKLDITEISLAKVTDEFIAHIRAAQSSEAGWDLSQASEFVLVAATLLDLKAARLLPQTGPEDDDDLALIEARDLLFARLLQYRAYKDLAHTFGERMATAGRMQPRVVGLEAAFAKLLPELVMTITNSRGAERERSIIQYSRDFGDTEKKVMFFTRNLLGGNKAADHLGHYQLPIVTQVNTERNRIDNGRLHDDHGIAAR